ncbi:MAG: type IV pilus twitching motility protein PilT [Bacillota bacterium]|nr:type IV pilus twitching motility protein PilT [Bacillota bacterium]
MLLNELLIKSIARHASDLHIMPGCLPVVRINGSLTPMDLPVFTPTETQALARQALSEEKCAILEEIGEVDASYHHADLGSFRVNAYYEQNGVAIAFRVISTVIPTIESLSLPAVVSSLARSSNGIILVTGPTGSGKSTTQAAMINQINEEKACHIITLEDPIEYIHKNRNSLITQREIGKDSQSFPTALRSALRQDPDIIMIGEMRDLETMSIAVTAAETGHLVLATLHTVNAAQSIARIIDVFLPHQQRQIQIQLANSLTGVISQRLVPRKDGNGRIVATEVLTTTTAIRNMIREGKTHQIYSSIQTGSRYGMHTMESSFKYLIDNDLIESDALLVYSTD